MNAVFERDYVAFSASLRFFWMRFVFALAMGVLVFAKVLTAYGSSDYADLGVSVLQIAVSLGTGLILITAPGIFATVLVHARAQGTLPVLLSTPLTPLRITFGAFGARAALIVLFVLATWPPIALALAFGGVRGSQLFEASAAALASGLIVSAPAFAVSAFARRTAAAVVSAYLCSATLLSVLGFAGERLNIGLGDEWYGAAISPFHAIQMSLAASPPPASSIGDWLPGGYFLLLWAIALSVACVLLAAWRLRSEGLGDHTPARGRFARNECRPLKHENPVLDHELRLGSLGARFSTSRGLLILLLLSEAVFFVLTYGVGLIDPGDLGLHAGVLGFQCLLLLLAVTAAGATALASEHESHVLDLMRVSPLTPGQIVIGKLAGLMRSFLPCLLVPLAHLAFSAFVLGIFSVFAIPAVALAGGLTMATWGLCGMSQSLEQGDPHRSVLRTMGLMGIFAMLTAGMVGMPVYGLARGVDVYVATSTSFGANPVASMLLGAALFRTGGVTEETASLAPPDLSSIAFGSFGGLLWLVLHAVVAYLLYRRLFSTYRLRFE